MALHLTDRNVPREIAKRIRTLIARKDAGDVTAAARRLDCHIADVIHPERIVAGDDTAALEFLATVVRAYDVDACWLLTGTSAGAATRLTSEARVAIVEVLDELGDRLLDEVRREHDGTADARRGRNAAASPRPRSAQPTSDGAMPMA